MNRDLPEHTHEGWFWFCPVLATPDGPDGMEVDARWWWLEWLFDLCELFEAARIQMSMAMWPDYEPTFMFKLRPRRK